MRQLMQARQGGGGGGGMAIDEGTQGVRGGEGRAGGRDKFS